MDASKMDPMESMAKKMDWWVYVTIVCMVFSIILALNYIVKKLRDSRMEQRERIRHHKPSESHPVHFQVENEPAPDAVTPTDNQKPEPDPAPKKVSVFLNKEQNIQDDKTKKEGEVTEDAKNTIKKVEEDKRRKVEELVEDPNKTISTSVRSGSSYDDYLHSIPVSDRSSPLSTNIFEEAKPVFLGKIYQDLHNEIKMNNKEKSTSKETSFSRETIPINDVTTVNQVKIDVEHIKAKIDKVEQNEDVNYEDEHDKTMAINKVKSPKDSNTIIKEILEKTVLQIQDSKSNTKICTDSSTT